MNNFEIPSPRTLAEFPDLPAVVDEIDRLVEKADHQTGKERKASLTEAQRLADEYQKHCEAGGNQIIQFRKLL